MNWLGYLALLLVVCVLIDVQTNDKRATVFIAPGQYVPVIQFFLVPNQRANLP